MSRASAPALSRTQDAPVPGVGAEQGRPGAPWRCVPPGLRAAVPAHGKCSGGLTAGVEFWP